MQACRPNFISEKFSRKVECTAKDWQEFWEIRERIGLTITALLQTNSAFEDSMIARSQIRIPKSKRVTILQSSLLRFYWQSFQHHAYIWEQKIGLLAKQIEKIPFEYCDISREKQFLILRKNASNELSELKKERGMTVHSWTKEHSAMYRLGMIEVLSEDLFTRNKLPGVQDVVGHAIDAAYDVKKDIKKWEKVMGEINEEIITHAVKVLLLEINGFNEKFKNKIVAETTSKAETPPDYGDAPELHLT